MLAMPVATTIRVLVWSSNAAWDRASRPNASIGLRRSGSRVCTDSWPQAGSAGGAHRLALPADPVTEILLCR
jgi:hypothetical protein